MRLRLLAAITLIAGPVLAADPELVSLAMPDSQVLAGINVQQAVLSPLGQFLLAQADLLPANELQKLVETTNFDPRRDLREILVSLKGQPASGSALFLARGTFDIAKLTTALSEGTTVETYKGVSILQKSKTEAMAFPDSTLAIFGEPADVRAAIDRRTAPTAINSTLAVEVNRVSGSEDAWFASTMPLSQLTPPPAGGGQNPLALYSKIQQASGGVKFGANVTLTVQLVSETAQDASMLTMLLKAAGVGFSGNSNPQAATVAELLKALNVTTDGTLTKVSWSMPESQLEQMIQAARPKNEAHKQEAPAAKMKPAPHAAPERMRVSGDVQKAKLVQQVPPVYPPLATQARVSGVVRLNAVIGKDGAVEEVTVVSGHPLLVTSAMDAVKQWVYEPTLLNGKPVAVVTQVEVNFSLEP